MVKSAKWGVHQACSRWRHTLAVDMLSAVVNEMYSTHATTIAAHIHLGHLPCGFDGCGGCRKPVALLLPACVRSLAGSSGTSDLC